MDGSTLYTIGTMLNHACDKGLEVDLLVAGQWLSGVVAAVDGYGVVLASNDDRHAVIRLEAVSAVKVAERIPQHTEIAAGARPMTGPAQPRAHV